MNKQYIEQNIGEWAKMSVDAIVIVTQEQLKLPPDQRNGAVVLVAMNLASAVMLTVTDEHEKSGRRILSEQQMHLLRAVVPSLTDMWQKYCAN